MTELIKALTRLANAASTWLEEGKQPLLPVAGNVGKVAAETVAETAVPMEKQKRHRRTRLEIMAEEQTRLACGAAESKPSQNGESQPTQMTEEQSSARVYDIAAAYVQRFQNDTPDGRERARNILKTKYGVPKIAALTHEQRLDLIAVLTAEIREADKVPA